MTEINGTADVTRVAWSKQQGHDQKVIWFKTMVNDLITELDQGEPSREASIAKTKLEEACMWAVKGMTR
jgi:hypothetical protein